MITTNDICIAVASVIEELQQICMHCLGIRPYKLQPYYQGRILCVRCLDRGWYPTESLDNIITNIKYPLTLLLKNDMIGWSAEIAIDGDSLKANSDRPAYDDPVDAVYEALFEALTDKLGAGRMGQYVTEAPPVSEEHSRPRRTTRGRGRPIKQ